MGLGGLSRLSAWWVRLGIWPERIAPGHPEQNGRHERLHRTLAAATVRPTAATLRAQQRRFERFGTEYNQERSHEALGGEPVGLEQIDEACWRLYYGMPPLGTFDTRAARGARIEPTPSIEQPQKVLPMCPV